MKIKKNILTLLLISFLSLPVFLPKTVMAQTTPWSGECISDGKNVDTGDVATLRGIECIVKNVLNIGVEAVGVSAFIMLVVGSIMHLTSAGEARKAETANKTMTYAIAAILLSVSGWIIINFIISFTGVSKITNFQLSNEPPTATP